jgi:hypothetical protein
VTKEKFKPCSLLKRPGGFSDGHVYKIRSGERREEALKGRRDWRGGGSIKEREVSRGGQTTSYVTLSDPSSASSVA